MQKLIEEGLTVGSADEWFQFWMDHWEKFDSLYRARCVLYRDAFATEDELTRVIERSSALCGTAIAERWPPLSGEIQSASEAARNACEMSATFKPLSSKDLRIIDLECAQILGSSLSWFVIALSSLRSLSSTGAHSWNDSRMADLLFHLVKETASAATRMASAGAALRNVDPENLIVVEATISAADDGFGYVATLSPLHLETCGETAEEMRYLVREAVRGYFRAEKKNGTLSEALEELEISGEAEHVAVSLYVREGDVTALSDVLILSL